MKGLLKHRRKVNQALKEALMSLVARKHEIPKKPNRFKKAEQQQKALLELANNKNTLGANLPFSDETYEQMKPHFRAAMAHFKATESDIRSAVRALVQFLVNDLGAGGEQLDNFKPYIKRFVEDVTNGVVRIGENEDAAITGDNLEQNSTAGNSDEQVQGDVQNDADGADRGNRPGSDLSGQNNSVETDNSVSDTGTALSGETSDSLKTIGVGLVFVCLAFLFLYSLIGNPFDELALLMRGQVVPGFIVATWEDVGDNDHGGAVWTHRAEYTYRLADGREFTQHTLEASGRLDDKFQNLKEPFPIEVEYLSDNPAISRIRGSGSNSIFEWLWRKAGLGFLLLLMLLSPGIILLEDGFLKLKNTINRKRANTS
jgi:hypothetical protein